MSPKWTEPKKLEPLIQNPTTREEWQLAVDAAKALVLIDAARAYGLIRGGPAVDVERCCEILDGGAARGIFPAHEGMGRFLVQWQRGQPCRGGVNHV